MDINELHRKLGHLNFCTLEEMVSKGSVSGLAIDPNSKSTFCTLCIKGKASRLPFLKESKTTYTKYGEKIVTDLWGPAQVTSLGGKNYAQFYHDMATSEDCVDFLQMKAEALEKYQQYEKWVKMQWNADIKCLGSDRGSEYLSNEFTKILKNSGTNHHLAMHDLPQSNGTAECSHRTHIE